MKLFIKIILFLLSTLIIFIGSFMAGCGGFFLINSSSIDGVLLRYCIGGIVLFIAGIFLFAYTIKKQ